MDSGSNTNSCKSNMMDQMSEEEDSEDEVWDSDDDAETIARIQRAHYAATAAMNSRRRIPARSRPMSQKRKLEAVRTFHDFTKKLKKDTGIRIKSLGGSNFLDLSDFSNEDSKSDSDGLSEPEFDVNPGAVEELNGENESYIDPFTGDFVEAKKAMPEPKPCIDVVQAEPEQESVQTLSISDIINDGDLDLSKNVEIAEVEGSELCTEKDADELLDIKQEETSQDYDVTEKLKEMGEISEKPLVDGEPEENKEDMEAETKAGTEEEKKPLNPNAVNVRRNIREVMDEKNLDASTLAAQRQESERLARVQEQQRIIREVQRQIAINRQNKIHQKTLSLLQGGSSILKKGSAAQKLNLPNTVLVKLPSGEVKKTGLKPGQVDLAKLSKAVPSGSALRSEQKPEKKEVVEIVDSSSGEETTSSSSDSDDCIMLSDSEVPPSPEAEEDPNNSGLHVNDTYNVPDEQGRVLINLGHPETEEDIFLAPQIARIIKPHQIGGVRFLFDNIIESVERFSTSTGFGCILAHSMGLGKTLQIVCFCDIFLRHTTFKTVLCIMPINTLQNWVAEFNMWLPVDATASPLSAHGEVRPRNFPIYVLNDSHKTLQMRAKVVKDWSTTGGVLMIGYELFRLLSMKKDKKPRKKKKGDAKNEEKEKEDKKNEPSANQQGIDSQGKTDDKPENDGSDPVNKPGETNDVKKDEPIDEEKRLLDEMYEALVKPGPDLVICDEGHRIKNSHSNISYALKQMRTKRRVVLTGYPLQNNLLEYWCMVDFVRPNYLGSKTEFCNMFERPIQNGQCIDSTPQDIRLMRYRAHVLHSLLVGFVQRRSHLVLQSTLPQKEEYVLLVRMTPLQRKLYEQFMNEVVRSTSVPNPLKAFAICCKIWNHPDVLYNFLKKRSEVNALIEEDLDLEEIGGVTKAGRARNSKAQPKRACKPRGAGKKPAATIPPNTTTSPLVPRQESGPYNSPYSQNGPFGPQNSYRPDQAGAYPPYPNYPNAPYYPPNSQNPGYTPNYDSNYYQQQTSQPPYGNDYPNQFPTQNPDGQNYNQNYWGNGNYFNNPGYFNNQYPNNEPPSNYPPSSGEFSNAQQYPPSYNTANSQGSYPANAIPPYQDNQNGYGNQQRPPYQGQYPPGYDFNTNTPQGSFNTNTPQGSFNTNTPQGAFNTNTPQGSQFPSNDQPRPTQYPNANASGPPYSETQYPNNQTPGTQYPNTAQTGPQFPKTAPAGSQYPGVPSSGPPYSNNGPQVDGQYPSVPPASQVAQFPEDTTPRREYPSQPYGPEYGPPNAPYDPNDTTYNHYNNRPQNYPYQANPAIKQEAEVKSEPNAQNQQSASYGTPGYNYNQTSPACYSNPNEINNYPGQYPNFPLETKTPLGSAGSGSPLPTWPLTEPLKTEIDKIKAEEKCEIKSESDGEVKIADLDTKTIVKNDLKKEPEKLTNDITAQPIKEKDSKNTTKSDASDSEEAVPKKGRKKKGKEPKKERQKPGPKPKPGGRAAKARKDRKTSKEKHDDSESEESEKEEKLSREEAKKAEEMTYDWAAELLKDYIPGIIENSAKMELFFYLLNESIKLGDRILLFSQSLFTLNLIENFLEKNYVPGTNLLWQRNTNYYRLDGSTHALEREKLINEFNSNPHIYLFLVSTRAGSLGINLVGANRVIVFDASWNPCHDTQAVCRVYRYGQRKPCFVYRFVMDCCLEKKIYDRQINKQGMADRVVDECNPDAVLSMKEITNLCFDNDEKETEIKDLSEHKDKYIDILMQNIIQNSWKLLTKEPFQHESLLVDRKEKKLSSAEKRLAQRGYELEKKAALAPKPTTAYRTVRTADGSLVQRPVASVRPMQQTARWIPADVWRRQGMTAQEMTLPLDVVIPTNSAEKTNIVLKAGQRVMVLKSPKGIYMQLESGKIIAIKTSLKGMTQKTDGKDNPLAKKILGGRPSSAANLPGSLKNNSAITITSKTGTRPPGLQRLMSRPNLFGGQSKGRLLPPGQRLVEIRNRLGDMKSYSNMRPKHLGKLLRPALPGSVSITKITKDPKKPDDDAKIETESEETHVLDSDDEDTTSKDGENKTEPKEPAKVEDKTEDVVADSSKSSTEKEPTQDNNSIEKEVKPEVSAPLVLTTDEKLPTEEALERKTQEENTLDLSKQPIKQMKMDKKMLAADTARAKAQRVENKINLLKNYRHQRQAVKPPNESSLTRLERTASSLNTEGLPDFRKNLDDITQSYSPSEETKPTKSRKKKSPSKVEIAEPIVERPQLSSSNTSHSVSSLLGSGPKNSRSVENTGLVPPIGPTPRVPTHNLPGMSPEVPLVNSVPSGMSEVGKPPLVPGHQPGAMQMGTMPPGPYPSNPLPEGSYPQYPGYGMGYGAYPSAPYGYGAYAGAPYYPPYGAPPGPAPTYPPAPTPEGYLPPNPQW